jgi:Na+-translocating ferredoxin:NAD+ oxidoreductase RnfE subunit
MNRRLTSHLFWGSHSPLSALGGTALIVMASSRLAFALVCAGALVWVFGLSAFIYSCTCSMMPSKGRTVILLFLTATLCGLFNILIGILNPLLIMETGFFLFFVPVWCMGSNFFEAAESSDSVEVLSRAVLEALTMGGLVIAVSLVREPLGLGTISIPGSVYGIREIFGGKVKEIFIPLRILSVSSGGLLLLGYGIALYRFFKNKSGISQE